MTTVDLRHVFAPFCVETRERLIRIGVVRHWRAGDVVLRGGGVASSVIVILQGQIRLSGSSTGGDERFFRMFRPGEYVGLVSAVGEVPFVLDAVAAEDCSLAHFNREQFLQVLAADGAAALLIARQVSRLAYAMTQVAIGQSESTLYGRVLAVLLHLAQYNASPRGDGQLVLQLSQTDIAKAVGASRQRVNIELRKLDRAGRIRLGYRHLVLLDPVFHKTGGI